jgi:hypothetical protein
MEQSKEIKELLDRLEQYYNEFRNTEFLNINQTAKYLCVSKRTLQNYRDKKLISYVQIKGKIYFLKKDLREFMERYYVDNHIYYIENQHRKHKIPE